MKTNRTYFTKYIDSIQDALKPYISNVKFVKEGGLTWVIECERKAINRFDESNENKEVNVKHLFDDFWTYIKIEFKKMDETYIPHLSVSFFYNSVDFGELHQICRAEWDGYTDSNVHEQPHWHITSNLPIERLIKDLTQDCDLDFVEDILQSSPRVEKAHFSMCHSLDGGNGYDITDCKVAKKWISFLMAHAIRELEYITEKKRKSFIS